LVFFFFLGVCASAQGTLQEEYEVIELPSASSTQVIRFNQPVGAVCLNIYEGSYTDAQLVAGTKTYALHQDADRDLEHDLQVSNLILLPSEVTEVEVRSGSMKGTIELHGFYKSHSPAPPTAFRLSEVPCAEPAFIPPSVWRAGMTPPVKAPDSTKVEHIII